MSRSIFLTFILAAALLVFSGCGSQHKNVIFIVDTSGSMNQNQLLSDVKISIERILQDLKPGDQVHLLTFDGSVRNLLSQSLTDQKEADAQAILEKVRGIEARGQWTDLVGALDHSLGVVKQLRESDKNGRTVLVLYTDGKHDPPPEARQRDIRSFAQLIKTYYKDYVPGNSWFIFYVELNEPDPELKQFLTDSGSGRVIEKGAFHSAINFIEPDEMNPEDWAKLAGILLLVIFIGHYILPWFGKARLVDLGGRKTIELGGFRRRLFRRHLVIGSLGDISIPGADARIGVTLTGKVYVEPKSGKRIEIDGKSVDFRVLLYTGQILRLGSHEFEFKRS